MERAGIAGLTFHDLRGTAVPRLALAGATEAEIVTLTGHTLRDMRSILDAHTLARDPPLGESAIRKPERRTKIPERPPERRVSVTSSEEKSAGKSEWLQFVDTFRTMCIVPNADLFLLFERVRKNPQLDL